MSGDWPYGQGDSSARVLAAAGMTREDLGRRVRAAWLEWARRQPDPKPGWLVPYDALGPADREVDDEIGAELFCAGWHARGRQ